MTWGVNMGTLEKRQIHLKFGCRKNQWTNVSKSLLVAGLNMLHPYSTTGLQKRGAMERLQFLSHFGRKRSRGIGKRFHFGSQEKQQKLRKAMRGQIWEMLRTVQSISQSQPSRKPNLALDRYDSPPLSEVRAIKVKVYKPRFIR